MGNETSAPTNAVEIKANEPKAKDTLKELPKVVVPDLNIPQAAKTKVINDFIAQSYTENKIQDSSKESADSMMEFKYFNPIYTKDDLLAARLPLGPNGTKREGKSPKTADIVDFSKPVTINDLICAGNEWHLWYLDQLEKQLAEKPLRGESDVFSIVEFNTSLNAFLKLFVAVENSKLWGLDTQLLPFVQTLIRVNTFYYAIRILPNSPLFVNEKLHKLLRELWATKRVRCGNFTDETWPKFETLNDVLVARVREEFAMACLVKDQSLFGSYFDVSFVTRYCLCQSSSRNIDSVKSALKDPWGTVCVCNSLSLP
jgi:hypothetical protein